MNGLAVCGLVYLVQLFYSYLSHALLDFSETGTTFYLMHALQILMEDLHVNVNLASTFL